MAAMTEAEYLTTMPGMAQVTPDALDCLERVDLGGYWRASVTPEDLGGHLFPSRDISVVYASETFQHVLVGSSTPNVYLVFVVRRDPATVVGHRLLNLNAHYGVQDPASH